MKKIVTFLTICAPLLIKAQGFQVSLQGQKQQAMAGTGTAHLQDGASLFFNPGAVSFLKNNSVSAGVTPVISNATYLDAASSTLSRTNNPTGFPFTGYVVLGKKESKFRYGLAAYTPFGSTIDWQPGWTGQFVVNRIQLSTVYIQPTFSYKLTEKLGIGAGFVYGIGNVNIQRTIPVSDEDGNYASAELAGKSNGFGFNAGLYFKATEKMAFGLSYRSGVKMDVEKGSATFTTPASLSANFPSGNFSTNLPLPKVISLGLAYSPSKKLTLAFDGNFIGWKTFDTIAFDFAQNTAELQDTKSPRNYQNTFSYRMGAQYAVNSKLDARAGVKYLVTPIRDGYLSPDTPDATHVNYSFGLGYKLSSKFILDMSVTIQDMKREERNIETQMNGKYHTNIIMPGISFNYNF